MILNFPQQRQRGSNPTVSTRSPRRLATVPLFCSLKVKQTTITSPTHPSMLVCQEGRKSSRVICARTSHGYINASHHINLHISIEHIEYSHSRHLQILEVHALPFIAHGGFFTFLLLVELQKKHSLFVVSFPVSSKAVVLSTPHLRLPHSLQVSVSCNLAKSPGVASRERTKQRETYISVATIRWADVLFGIFCYSRC